MAGLSSKSLRNALVSTLTFGRPARSYRGGDYFLDGRLLAVLTERGVKADVTGFANVDSGDDVLTLPGMITIACSPDGRTLAAPVMEDLLFDAEVRLFAPAIFGANPAGLIGVVYHFLLGSHKYGEWVNPVMKSARVIRQLTEDSKKLNEIKTVTEQLVADKRHRALTANLIFGADEQIVEADKYKHDVLEEAIEHRDHWSICKPYRDFRKPLEFVAYGKSHQSTTAK